MSRVGQRLVALTMAGAVAFSYPVLAISDVEVRPAGIPLLYLYLFAVWCLLIGAMAVVVERRP